MLLGCFSSKKSKENVCVKIKTESVISRKIRLNHSFKYVAALGCFRRHNQNKTSHELQTWNRHHGRHQNNAQRGKLGSKILSPFHPCRVGYAFPAHYPACKQSLFLQCIKKEMKEALLAGCIQRNFRKNKNKIAIKIALCSCPTNNLIEEGNSVSSLGRFSVSHWLPNPTQITVCSEAIYRINQLSNWRQHPEIAGSSPALTTCWCCFSVAPSSALVVHACKSQLVCLLPEIANHFMFIYIIFFTADFGVSSWFPRSDPGERPHWVLSCKSWTES